MSTIFFIGIGGSGMNSLALFLKSQGENVFGSDRSFDDAQAPQLKQELISHGIHCVPQDGRHLPGDIDAVIYSSAVEDDNPDFMESKHRNLPLKSRAQKLSEIFNAQYGIAICGTSGKSTVCGMIAKMMVSGIIDFSFIAGARIKNLLPKKNLNYLRGNSNLFMIEADESDGSLVLYRPKISLINNITKDHKDVDELIPMFQKLIGSTSDTVIMNHESLNLGLHLPHPFHTFSIDEIDRIKLSSSGSSFQWNGHSFELKVPGRHNIINALAAIKVALSLKMDIAAVQKGLAEFEGIERRLERVGTTKNITVLDDFAHNPAKIEATLKTVKEFSRRIWAVFQPHGYGPLAHQWNELIATFKNNLRSEDSLYLLPIYDAGGTADRTISVQDFGHSLSKENIRVRLFQDRAMLAEEVSDQAHSGDVIIVMGARDPSLPDVAQRIFERIHHIS